MYRKQGASAAVFAFVLIIAARVPLSVQQIGTYDPWLDYNGDGIIDVNDLQPLSQAYGTSGDPTRNVTIAQHVTKLVRAAVSVYVPPSTEWDSGLVSIDGYSKITVLISIMPYGSNQLTLNASDYAGTMWRIELLTNIGNYWVKTYDVMNQQIQIIFGNGLGTGSTLDVDIYLVA